MSCGAHRPCPGCVPHPDSLTNARRVHAAAHLIDHARAIAMGDDQREGQCLVAHTGAGFHIGRIDAGTRELDANLAAAADGVSISVKDRTSLAGPTRW